MPDFKLTYVNRPAVRDNCIAEARVKFVFEGEWSSDLLVGTPEAAFSNKSDGWILQHIVMTAENFDGEGDSQGKKKEEYWEAWRVDDGKVFIPADGLKAKEESHGDTFAIPCKPMDLKHRQLTEGWAVFVHDGDRDYNFPEDRANWQTKVGAAKDLPSRPTFNAWETIVAKRRQVNRAVLYHKLEVTFAKGRLVNGSLGFDPA